MMNKTWLVSLMLLALAPQARAAAPAAPRNVTATAVSPSTVVITWNRAETAEQVTEYQIDRIGRSVATVSPLVTNAPPAAYYQDVGRQGGQAYSYRVTAVNADGASAPSELVSVTTPESARGRAVIYVDSQLTSDTNAYSAATRGVNPSAKDLAFTSIQAAVRVMLPGDTIMLRGGVYHESHIDLTSNRHGLPDAPNTIKSYPGEWAIVDGQHRDPTQFRPAVLWATGGAGFSRWVFESFEITGGGHPDQLPNLGSGIALEAATHCVFRGLYVHDNYESTSQGASGGITLIGGGSGNNNNLFEYNYFRCNGSPSGYRNTANSNLAIYGYTYEPEAQIENTRSKNEIRYNLFDGSCDREGWYTPIAFVHKGFSRKTGFAYAEAGNAADNPPNDATYRAFGDKIHHNVIVNHRYGLRLDSDYVQVYNNVIDLRDDGLFGIQTRDGSSNRRGSFWSCIYNNTILASGGDALNHPIVGLYDCSTQPVPASHLRAMAVNNIIVDAGVGYDWAYISFEEPSSRTPNCAAGEPFDLAALEVSRNLFFNCRDGGDVVIRVTNRTFTVQEAEASPAADLLWKIDAGAGLLLGTVEADRYRTNPQFELDAAHTVANGGLGGAHPYLADVEIPTYVGATRPNDDFWVAGVLSLRSVDALKSRTGEPDWIEGGAAARRSVCGDNACDEDETSSTCPQDCAVASSCGDSRCDGGETSTTCPHDCSVASSCGDSRCDEDETSGTCPQDCTVASSCGDNRCDDGETSTTCPQDCPAASRCGDAVCDATEAADSCPADCLDPGTGSSRGEDPRGVGATCSGGGSEQALLAAFASLILRLSRRRRSR